MHNLLELLLNIIDLFNFEGLFLKITWGYSSVGRAPALQAGGQEFESLHLHSPSTKVWGAHVPWKPHIEQKELNIQTNIKTSEAMREIAWKTNNKFVNLEPEMQRYAS